MEDNISYRDLALCAQCGVCTGSCVSARHSAGNPRKLALTALRRGLSACLSDELVWSCAQCYACKVRCPHGIDIPSLIVQLRKEASVRGTATDVIEPYAEMLENISKTGLSLQRNPMALHFAEERLRVQAPQLSGRVQGPEPIGKLSKLNKAELISLFPGCLALCLYPGVISSSLIVLSSLGYGVTLPSEIYCCELPPALFGLVDRPGARSAKGLASHTSQIVTPCNGCYMTLCSAGDIAVFQIAEILRGELCELEKLRGSLSDLRVATHYGCHYLFSHPELVLDDPENPSFLDDVAEALGAKTVEYDEKHACCGAPIPRAQSELALDVARAKLRSIVDSGANAIVVMCTACLLALERAEVHLVALDELDEYIPVIHVTQLVGLALGLDAEKDLGLHLQPTAESLL